MFIFAPISQGLINAYGWSDTLILMSAAMLVIPVLAIPLAGNAKSGSVLMADVEQSVGAALREALGHQSFLLLTSGFFVCGFQVAFITAHFPAYIGDIGIDARYAVIALALIGFFNIIGSLASGVIGQHYSKPIFLAWIYLGRSVVVTAFLLLPQTPASVIIFAIAMGLLWLSRSSASGWAAISTTVSVPMTPFCGWALRWACSLQSSTGQSQSDRSIDRRWPPPSSGDGALFDRTTEPL